MGVVVQCLLDVPSLFYATVAVFLIAVADAMSRHWDQKWVQQAVYFFVRAAAVVLLALAVNHRSYTTDVLLCILVGVSTFYVMMSRLYPGWPRSGFKTLGMHWAVAAFAACMVGVGATFVALYSGDERREPYRTTELVAVVMVFVSDLFHFVLHDPDKPTALAMFATAVNTLALAQIPWAVAQHCE